MGCDRIMAESIKWAHHVYQIARGSQNVNGRARSCKEILPLRKDLWTGKECCYWCETRKDRINSTFPSHVADPPLATSLLV